MNKVGIFFILVTVFIFAAGIFLFSTKKEGARVSPTNYEYYWSSSCSHCKNVEEFLSSWEGKDQITMDKFQVDSDSSNISQLLQRGKDCKLLQNQIGSVPSLVTPNGECFIGDTPIIEYFKSI